MLNDLWVIVDTYIQGNWEQSPGCNPWNWTNVARDTVVCIVAVSYCIARYGRQLRFLVWFDFGTFSSGGYLWICYHQWMKFFVHPVVMGSHVGKVLLQHCLQHVHPICSAPFSHVSGDSQVALYIGSHRWATVGEMCKILLPRGWCKTHLRGEAKRSPGGEENGIAQFMFLTFGSWRQFTTVCTSYIWLYYVYKTYTCCMHIYIYYTVYYMIYIYNYTYDIL